MSLNLQLLPGEFAACRLPPAEPLPAWAGSAVFSSVTRTADELSIICPAAAVPAGIKAVRSWRLLKVAGPLDFGAVGILASITAPLARAGISLLAVATFDTDYVLVKTERLEEALRALEAAGHSVRRS
ncbi:MAG: ACT domain-containing protein [bacterium]|nr:ACT domain-containing protein [bacterium]MDI1337393.1 ACT domain-containing protein [Lacunisphaera sp.]